jgi:hypothetical protein
MPPERRRRAATAALPTKPCALCALTVTREGGGGDRASICMRTCGRVMLLAAAAGMCVLMLVPRLDDIQRRGKQHNAAAGAGAGDYVVRQRHAPRGKGGGGRADGCRNSSKSIRGFRGWGQFSAGDSGTDEK